MSVAAVLSALTAMPDLSAGDLPVLARAGDETERTSHQVRPAGRTPGEWRQSFEMIETALTGGLDVQHPAVDQCTTHHTPGDPPHPTSHHTGDKI